jgi:histidinol-phosphatase (PHP family)
MIPHDYHIHSNYSADSNTPIPELCQRAVALGIPEIGFAEHYDLHPDENPRDWLRLEPWWEELKTCRDAFWGRLLIRAGIEIGEPHLFAAEAQAMLARAPFDYAMGSLHWVGRRAVFDSGYFDQPVDEAYRLYFEELERMTRAGGFDVLGHLDVPARASTDKRGRYDPGLYEEPIRAVLGNCIKQGIALDVNTSALRRRAQILMPGLDILRWYAEMGGRHVTLGSDAHRADQVAARLDLALETIRAAGLTHVTQFERREKHLVPFA